MKKRQVNRKLIKLKNKILSPFVKDKKTDPAVIVIDELGRFVIPLLSGHIGGANELSKKISKFTNSIEVITTATDINNKFAVDVFAKNNNLYISNMTIAKEISSKILEGEKIGFLSDFNFKGNIPSELVKKNIENIVEEEKKKVIAEIERASKMLSNPGFVNKAPEAKINEEKAKLEKYQNMLKNLEERLK